jgi:ubiquinone/menaquinone biosynthesis C-methylase UbiE
MGDDLPQWYDIANLLPPECASILDIGCGDGRTLSLCPNIPYRAGIDYSSEAIDQARRNVPGADFRVAMAESLPFEDAHFDAAISCVTLPLVNIPVALRECARVLKSGAPFYLSFHTWDFINLLWQDYRPNLAGRVYRVYVTINGLIFHFTGKVFRYPLKPTLTESFQTKSALTRALTAAGFRDIQELPRRVPSFVATRR